MYVPFGGDGPLPVVVWTHRGDFIFGDESSEYDGNYELIMEDADIGKNRVY